MYTAGSCKYLFEVLWCGVPGQAGQVPLSWLDKCCSWSWIDNAGIRVLQPRSLLRLLFLVGAVVGWNSHAGWAQRGKEDPDEGIPFVRMGRYWEEKSREGPSSSLRGRVLPKLSHGVHFQLS